MKTVLVVSRADDIHTLVVAQHLRKLRLATAVLSPQDLGESVGLGFAISSEAPGTWSASGALPAIDFEEIGAVWLRRLAQAPISPHVIGREERRFVRREWNQTVEGLIETLDRPTMSPLTAQRSAVKARQLSAARNAGLRIPRTLLTSDADQARCFVEELGGRVIVKSLSPHRSQPVYTRRWRNAHAEQLDDLAIAPAVFQEEVAGCFDARVTIVGNRVFAARAELVDDPVDIRLRPDQPFVAFDLPTDVESKLHALLRELGLLFGCIDLRMTPQGELVFFEVNPQGQFLFIEVWTRLPIALAVAEYLAELADDSRSQPHREESCQAGPPEPLAGCARLAAC